MTHLVSTETTESGEPERRPMPMGHKSREKRTGARSAGNPHAACDEEGTGNGVVDRIEAPAIR